MSLPKARDENGRFSATVRGQRHRVHVRFTDDCFGKVRNLAADKGSSIAAQVEQLVEFALNNKQQDNRILISVMIICFFVAGIAFGKFVI